MNKNALLMTAMACLTLMFVATTWSPAQSRHPNDGIGRYQFSNFGFGYQGKQEDKQETGVWVIDTVTSDTWYYTGTTWRNAGKADR